MINECQKITVKKSKLTGHTVWYKITSVTSSARGSSEEVGWCMALVEGRSLERALNPSPVLGVWGVIAGKFFENIGVNLCKIIFWRKMFYSSNIVLHTLAKDCKENIVAVADAYNINVAQVLHLDNSSLKDLFWEHFVKAVKP